MRIAVVLVLSVMACGRGTGTTPASVPQLDEEPAKTQDPPASLPGIDAMTFLTKESFRPAMPPNAPAGLLDKVKFESIRLLDPEIRTRVNPDLLRELLELCISSTIASFGLSEKPIEVRIHYTTNAGKNTLRVDTKGSPDTKLLGYIHQDLGGVPPLGVSGDIAVQIHASVNGGSKEPWVAGEALAAPPIEGVYIPANQLPPDPPTQKAKMLYVRLVTPESDIAKRTTPRAFGAFVEAIQAHAESTIGTSTASFELTLEMHCTPSGHTMQIGFTGVVDATFSKQAQALADAVKAMPTLATTGDVVFVIGLTIN